MIKRQMGSGSPFSLLYLHRGGFVISVISVIIWTPISLYNNRLLLFISSTQYTLIPATDIFNILVYCFEQLLKYLLNTGLALTQMNQLLLIWPRA